MGYLIDTNVFLRFYIKESEEKHRDSKLLVDKIRRNVLESRVYTADIIFAEMEWTLHSYYKIAKRDRIEFLKRIRTSLNPRKLSNFDMATALGIYKDHKVKFIDCLIASHPRIQSGEITVISYDTDFDKLGISRMEPADLL